MLEKLNIKRGIKILFRSDMVFESLLAMNWLWLFVLALLPREIVVSTTLNYFIDIFGYTGGTIFIGLIALMSIFALLTDVLFARQALLLINFAVIGSLGFKLVFRLPTAAAAGNFVILGVLCIITFISISMKGDNTDNSF